MLKKVHIVFTIGILFSAFIVFKSLFFGSAVWGDAPFFFNEGLRELVSEPQTWTSRGTVLGGINNLLWLSPLMLKYGLLHQLFGLENGVIIRLLFYLPAIAFAFFSSWVFARYLNLSMTGRFITCLIYGLNTYFLLLIDGGQVGVALAYGLFPFALWALRKLTEKPNINNFYLSIFFIFALGVADPRFSLISLLIALVWYLLELAFKIKKFEVVLGQRFFLLCLSYFFLNFYWVYPLIKLGGLSGGEIPGLNLSSILNGLFLFQPHWPNNEFGKVVSPAFYFVGIPLLIFSNFLFKKNKEKLLLLVLFLFCVFLAKGATPPLGGFYDWLLINIPFFHAFRDSTKFFTPLILFAAVLIGNVIEFPTKLKLNPIFKHSFTFLVLSYFIFLVHPAILGNLKGVFAGKHISQELLDVKNTINSNSGFSRSAWFPERHPFSFQNINHPAIDAKDLVNLRPLASLNTGTFDRFNFFHNNETYNWLRIFGIKHLVFSGEVRKELSSEEEQEWNKLVSLIEDNKSYKKLSNYPIYEVSDTLPNIYLLDKMVGVVGDEEVYKTLKNRDENFDITNHGFVFFEDGKTDPRNFQGVASGSAVILFNNKHEEDLTLSFLQKYFVGSGNAQGAWAIRQTSDYLKSRYELLIQGVETKEFDYNQGMAFSSQPGEEIGYKINIPADGKYILAIRSFAKSEGEQLDVSLDGKNYEIFPHSQKFSWYINEEVILKKGKHVIKVQNPQGFKVLNVVALVPEKEWIAAWELTRQFTQHFKTLSVVQDKWSEEPEELIISKREEVQHTDFGTLRKKVTLPKEKWLVLTDAYHKEWKLVSGEDKFNSVPVYSTINGFYTERGGNSILVFKGQEYFRWGLWVSIISILILATYFFWNKANEKSL